MTCPKCGGAMQRGWSQDVTHGGRRVESWSPGAPHKSFWTGIRNPKVELPIARFRCEDCGYLESYARAEFAADRSGASAPSSESEDPTHHLPASTKPPTGQPQQKGPPRLPPGGSQPPPDKTPPKRDPGTRGW